MNYRLIRNAGRAGEARRITVGLALGAILLLLFNFFYPAALRAAVYRLAVPFWKIQGFLEDAAAHFSSYLSFKSALISENERLREKELEQERLLLDRILLVRENAELKEMFGRPVKEGRILAAVLAAPPLSPYDTFVLDAGSQDGVAAGDSVAAGSVVMGRIVQVFPRASLAQLFSTAGVKTSVFILHDKASVPAEAEGAGGGTFIVRLPKEVPVSEGDSVTLPGLQSVLFARVQTIEGGAAQSFQTIYFRNPVSVGGLRFVEVKKENR